MGRGLREVVVVENANSLFHAHPLTPKTEHCIASIGREGLCTSSQQDAFDWIIRSTAVPCSPRYRLRPLQGRFCYPSGLADASSVPGCHAIEVLGGASRRVFRRRSILAILPECRFDRGPARAGADCRQRMRLPASETAPALGAECWGRHFLPVCLHDPPGAIDSTLGNTSGS